MEAIVEVVQGGKHNGYFASFGMQCAREAVADHINSPTGQHQVTAAVSYFFNPCNVCVREFSVVLIVEPSLEGTLKLVFV